MRRVRIEYQELAQQMGALIYEEVPDKGPPPDTWRFAELYQGLIYEFKAVEQVTQRKELWFRIACFFDGASAIVCTNAFFKTGATPPDQATLALRERERYFRDKGLNNLDLVDWTGRGNKNG